MQTRNGSKEGVAADRDDAGTVATRRKPVVGVIVPPADGAVPPELPQLYGDRLDFIAEGLALGKLTPDGYDQVIDKVAAAARRLVERGAGAVALMGTSLSFYRGTAFNQELVRTMKAATGVPVTTMSNAIVEALQAVGARRLAVATAYTDPVNQRLREFLQDSGFEVLALEALDLVEVADVHAVGDDQLLALGKQAGASAPGADGLLISCGGLRTLPVEPPLEQSLGIPVVSSAVAGAWAAARLAGHTGSAVGGTRLLSQSTGGR